MAVEPPKLADELPTIKDLLESLASVTRRVIERAQALEYLLGREVQKRKSDHPARWRGPLDKLHVDPVKD